MANENLTEPQRLWVEALRSGKYEQAKSVLCALGDDNEPVGFCCLGVACEVAIAAGVEVDVKNGSAADRCRIYGTSTVFLPFEVQDWLGLNSSNGRFKRDSTLSNLNDRGEVFEAIADIIESRPEALFA